MANEENFMNYKPVGIIGSGNMGTGIMKGLILANLLQPHDINATNSRNEELNKLKAKGVLVYENNQTVAEKSKTIILSVKPSLIHTVLSEILPHIKNKLIISVASGISVKSLEEWTCASASVIRVMPNTAVEVNEGCAAITAGSHASANDIAACTDIFKSVCKVCVIVSEDNIDSMIGISGSGIAYMYVVAEALIDAGVKMGLPRDVANQLVSQTMIGAGQMMQQTKEHPMQLKDRVTSPGGTTICGIAKLEELGLRNALIKAAEAAKERAQKH